MLNQFAVLSHTFFTGSGSIYCQPKQKDSEENIYNIDLAQQTNDPRLFKKLQGDIWEFRTRFEGQQIRLLAFWDKTTEAQTLVFATHGLIKKLDKMPAGEIQRAIRIRTKYFENKPKK